MDSIDQMERLSMCVEDATATMRKASAEIDRLRAENERLRTACEDVLVSVEQEMENDPEWAMTAQYLRAALK